MTPDATGNGSGCSGRAFDSVHFVLGAGSYTGTVTQPYTARLDDFDFCGP